MFLFTRKPRDFKGAVFLDLVVCALTLCTASRHNFGTLGNFNLHQSNKQLPLYRDDCIAVTSWWHHRVSNYRQFKIEILKSLKINKKSSVWDRNLILLPNAKVREGLSSWHIVWPLWPLLPVKQEVAPHLKMVKARNMIVSLTAIV